MTPVDWMVEDASAQLDHLRKLVGFVTSFRDGQIGLEEFLSGPSFLDDPEDSEEELMNMLIDLVHSRPRGKKRGRARTTPEDCPF